MFVSADKLHLVWIARWHQLQPTDMEKQAILKDTVIRMLELDKCAHLVTIWVVWVKLVTDLNLSALIRALHFCKAISRLRKWITCSQRTTKIPKTAQLQHLSSCLMLIWLSIGFSKTRLISNRQTIWIHQSTYNWLKKKLMKFAHVLSWAPICPSMAISHNQTWL